MSDKPTKKASYSECVLYVGEAGKLSDLVRQAASAEKVEFRLMNVETAMTEGGGLRPLALVMEEKTYRLDSRRFEDLAQASGGRVVRLSGSGADHNEVAPMLIGTLRSVKRGRTS